MKSFIYSECWLFSEQSIQNLDRLFSRINLYLSGFCLAFLFLFFSFGVKLSRLMFMKRFGFNISTLGKICCLLWSWSSAFMLRIFIALVVPHASGLNMYSRSKRSNPIYIVKFVVKNEEYNDQIYRRKKKKRIYILYCYIILQLIFIYLYLHIYKRQFIQIWKHIGGTIMFLYFSFKMYFLHDIYFLSFSYLSWHWFIGFLYLTCHFVINLFRSAISIFENTFMLFLFIYMKYLLYLSFLLYNIYDISLQIIWLDSIRVGFSPTKTFHFS